MWVVEYSKTQDSFYVTTLIDSVKKNQRMFYSGRSNDYQIIALADDMDEAYRKLESIKVQKGVVI